MQKYTCGFVDPKSIIIQGQKGPDYGVFAEGTTVPTDGTSGYAPGCLFLDVDAAAGANLFVNNGTTTSCLFMPIGAGGVIQWTAAGTISPVLHAGRTIAVNNATGFATTLPAFTGTGNVYHFFIQTTVSSGSHTFVATGAFLFGNIVMGTDSAFQAGTLFTAGMAESPAGSTTMTLDGSTRGGIKGDWFEIRDIATNVGSIRGVFSATGTEATPFS